MPDTLASIHVSARQRYHDLMAVLRERADVQALYLTGSLQREDQTADAWSDIDLTLVTRDPAAYRESEAWLREVASIDFRVLYTPRHLRVLFHDGVLLELGVFDEVDVRQPHPLLGIGAGRVILDRANLTDALERVAGQHSPFEWSAAHGVG
ncbi:hypothetical protein GCM10008955_32940 [Deinococcus malanensis]|uniref:Nucleotidyltransferase domain-containing protein n=1 Tax=Deinococcus malanensis TaxID=1706855 RepID=A0ABQ2F2Y6_9DEIO|nr:aminoglycoside 6-adenylyltransferase [Deinococcus malanensis]GGK36530.1 hypothetical protein GCM10008955_32940 [Deinococcus malanensis]